MNVVVVGVDGSGNSREALRSAMTEAAWRNAKVVAVHVVHYPVGFGYGGGIAIAPETIMEVGRDALSSEVDAVLSAMDDDPPVEIEQQVRLGHIGSQLLAIGDDDDINVLLTVVGSRGIGGFRGLLIGSVTTYLVHHLTSPLLVVPVSDDEGE